MRLLGLMRVEKRVDAVEKRVDAVEKRVDEGTNG